MGRVARHHHGDWIVADNRLLADRRRQKWRRIGRHERDHIPLCHLESPVGAGTVVVGVPHRHKAQAVSFRFLSGQFSAQFTGDCTGRLMTLDHSGGRGFLHDLRFRGWINCAFPGVRQIHFHTHNTVTRHPTHISRNQLPGNRRRGVRIKSIGSKQTRTKAFQGCHCIFLTFFPSSFKYGRSKQLDFQQNALLLQ